MNILKTKNADSLYIEVSGRLDSVTAPEFEASVKPDLDGVKDLALDFKSLDYISSAGLRVLLMMQKHINGHGTMKIMNVSEPIKEVFDMTGFTDILSIE